MGFHTKSIIKMLLRSKSYRHEAKALRDDKKLEKMTLFSTYLIATTNHAPVDDTNQMINQKLIGYFYIAGLYDEIMVLECFETEESALHQFLERFLLMERPDDGVILGYKRGDRNMWNLLQDVETDTVDFIPRVCRMIQSIDSERLQRT